MQEGFHRRLCQILHINQGEALCGAGCGAQVPFHRGEHGEKTTIARAIDGRRTNDGELVAATLAHFLFAGEFAASIVGNRVGRVAFANRFFPGARTRCGQARDM